MLFHLSIDSREPRRVAGVIAELFGSNIVMPFPPVGNGASFMALAGDERNSGVEVYPRGTHLKLAEGQAEGEVVEGGDRLSATHFAMATPLDEDQVLAIAAREGWTARVCSRGGQFDVIEVWLENDRMVEVLTAPMQADYLGLGSIARGLQASA
ncbi:MAG: hypothetical protein ACKOPM_00145 [Novosphingobium sp.]